MRTLNRIAALTLILVSSSIAAMGNSVAVAGELPADTGLAQKVFLHFFSFRPLRDRSSANHNGAPAQASRKKRRVRKPDVIYYPTPPETVAEMLRLANIKKGEVLYDLGSGDGRIPIAAARASGIRAVGIEIDPKLVAEAEENARSAGVSELVSFRTEDMFRVDIREASIVTLYLSEKLNVLLRPKLLRELRPGSRIVSHDFRMGDWKPEQTVRVPWGQLYRTVYLWTVPRPRKIKKPRG